MHIRERDLTIPLYIGHHLWPQIREYLAEKFAGHSLYVIADAQVAGIYRGTAEEALGSHSGFRGVVEFPEGEQYKSRRQKEHLEDLLLGQKAGRDTVIIAMGGGVTGDLAGYLAATLHRGVPLLHLPTSLLAQVDSSIGGKVGINHPAGKNLIGAFYQPQAIFCDVDFLRTLPEAEFLNGMAEVIKYAVILDDELWQWLEEEKENVLNREEEILQRLIMRCAQLKIRVVEADEKESGYRSLLNFGHTIGHALEQLSNYQVKHGLAVAAGMKIAVLLSQRFFNYPRERVRRLLALIHTYQLDDVHLEHFSIEELWECIQGDKKARQQNPRFTLMAAPHKPKLFYQVEKRELEHVLKASPTLY